MAGRDGFFVGWCQLHPYCNEKLGGFVHFQARSIIHVASSRNVSSRHSASRASRVTCDHRSGCESFSVKVLLSFENGCLVLTAIWRLPVEIKSVPEGWGCRCGSQREGVDLSNNLLMARDDPI